MSSLLDPKEFTIWQALKVCGVYLVHIAYKDIEGDHYLQLIDVMDQSDVLWVIKMTLLLIFCTDRHREQVFF